MILNTKYNIPLTVEEDKEMREYAKSLDYNIPLGVEIMKNKKLDGKNGDAIALFHMFHLHTIFITEDDVWLQELIEKIAHEEVHRRDRILYGFFKYCFMVLPFLRERYLEPQARAMEKSLNLRYNVKVQAGIIKKGRKLKKDSLKQDK